MHVINCFVVALDWLADPGSLTFLNAILFQESPGFCDQWVEVGRELLGAVKDLKGVKDGN